MTIMEYLKSSSYHQDHWLKSRVICRAELLVSGLPQGLFDALAISVASAGLYLNTWVAFVITANPLPDMHDSCPPRVDRLVHNQLS